MALLEPFLTFFDSRQKWGWPRYFIFCFYQWNILTGEVGECLNLSKSYFLASLAAILNLTYMMESNTTVASYIGHTWFYSAFLHWTHSVGTKNTKDTLDLLLSLHDYSFFGVYMAQIGKNEHNWWWAKPLWLHISAIVGFILLSYIELTL